MSTTPVRRKGQPSSKKANRIIESLSSITVVRKVVSWIRKVQIVNLKNVVHEKLGLFVYKGVSGWVKQS